MASSAFSRDVAIVGLASVFPGASSVQRFWTNIVAGVDAITDVPATRWDPVYFDPTSSSADRLYCKRGGFVDGEASFDPLAFGIMPNAASGTEPDQLLALHVAAQAIEDASLASALPRERTGVILGRGGYLTPGMARLNQFVHTAQQLVESLRTLVPGIRDDQLEAVKDEFQNKLAGGQPGNIGLVPNLAASRIANRLDLRGPAYTVDAACASSLVAVDQACTELAIGRCDVVVAGGVHVCHDVTFWSVFSQLGALSRSQQIRPFDRSADGLLIGEGAGVVVLKRLADAERAGDRIYAVIRGTGVSSDGRESSIMKPRVDGQVSAVQQAWAAAELDPATVGLIEAHGTATQAGDDAELRTLAQAFGAADSDKRAALGSVKSMIGHTMPAAGIAGLIKATLAVHHGVLPPSLHCAEPNPLVEQTRFRVVGETQPWAQTATPRRAGVNAFGFGGINTHVVIEQHGAGGKPSNARAVTKQPDVLFASAQTPGELLAALDGGSVPSGSCRIAVFDPSPSQLERARKIIGRGKPWHGRKDIWFSPRGLGDDGGRVALLFPGIEAEFEPRVDDVADYFGLPALTTPPRETALARQGEQLIAVGGLLHTALQRIGVRADAVAGHSIGEWSGMVAAGMLRPEAVDTFIAGLADATFEVPDVVYAALGCGADKAQDIIGQIDGVAISHDNCPRQSIICGAEQAIDEATSLLRAARVLCQKLPFRSGFHSPMYAAYVDQHRRHFEEIELSPATVPLWSATSGKPYPEHDADIRDLCLAHLVEPVRFRSVIDGLYDQGVRVFVQVGPGSLTGFTDDTLGDRPGLTIAANTKRRSGMAQLARVAAALFVEGISVDLDALPLVVQTAGGTTHPTGAVALDLGTTLVRHSEPLDLPGQGSGATVLPALPRAAATDPVMVEHDRNLREIVAAQQQVIDAWSRRPSAPRESNRRVKYSVSEVPELVDHTFYRQPEGWPHMADRYPVVPMTMHLETMIARAVELVPGRVAVALEDVRAYRWLAVAPAVELDVSARYDGRDRVKVRIGDYVSGTVVVADTYPAAPAAKRQSLQAETTPPVDGRRLYEERWMFHGPAYRGVVDIEATGEDGIRGTLTSLPAPGALLDNAGQLMGYWIMNAFDTDFLAFPIRIARLALFGPMPTPGTRVECSVHITRSTPNDVRADMQLSVGGRVWADISDWADHRFDTDAPLFAVLRYPEHNALATRVGEDYYLAREHWRTASSRDLVARRYLNSEERAKFDEVGPRRKRGWLLGRIAVKDAVRDWLWRRGHGPLFPIEIAVDNLEDGRPVISGPLADDLRVSIAHKDDVAVAHVAVGRAVGVDIERVEPRTEGFAAIAFTAAERSLRAGAGSDGEPDEWLTRVWAAKEAFAKSLGTGLQGNPKKFVVLEAASERLLVATADESTKQQAWIKTRREGDYVVAWTL